MSEARKKFKHKHTQVTMKLKDMELNDIPIVSERLVDVEKIRADVTKSLLNL